MTAILLSLGTLLAFYFISHNQLFSLPIPKGSTAVSPVTKPVTSKPVSLTLNLSAPEDNLLTFDPDLLLQGKTSPQAKVILILEKEDLALEANNFGDFSTTVKLTEGVNNITVAAFDNLGNKKSEERTVFYSKEKI